MSDEIENSQGFSDKVMSIDEMPKVDRSDLNIGSSKSKKPNSIIVGIFLLIGLAVICVAIFLSFNKAGSIENEVDLVEEDINYDLGNEKSSVEESNNYFKQFSKKIEEKRLRDEKQKEDESMLVVDKEPKVSVQESVDKPLVSKIGSSTPIPRPVRSFKPSVKRTNTSSGSSASSSQSPGSRKLSGEVTFSPGGDSSFSGLLGGSSEPSFDNSFNASRFANGSASLRESGSLDFLLIHGMNIPCSLYTQIISDYTGFVTCRVISDIYSANGSVLLIEAGSLVSGTQSVTLELGKARTFTTWSDIQTPNGASIFVDSLGTGPLGAAGHEVWVDNHFKERFGGAILLSFVDDALSAAADSASNRDIQFDNSTQNVGDMAETALESSINIAPTGYSYLGQRINILLTRDIDMSSVYTVGDIE